MLRRAMSARPGIIKLSDAFFAPPERVTLNDTCQRGSSGYSDGAGRVTQTPMQAYLLAIQAAVHCCGNG
jgi:hypothetical protein